MRGIFSTMATLVKDRSRAKPLVELSSLTLDYPKEVFGGAIALHADGFEWLRRVPEASLHALLTDPPYGLEEYEIDQLDRLHSGNKGGIWRIPPSFDGHARAPLPRFTALTQKQRTSLREFFQAWGELVARAVRPGGHVFVAGNAFLSQLVWSAIAEANLEFRGEVIRLVRTLRGGDRPKNAHEEFADVCSIARGCYEPWGVFRVPLPKGARVSDCLREFETGGLRRMQDGRPFEDVIESERTPRRERNIAEHPSLKPQSFLRRIAYAALPLGRGIIADPFMGSGSTLAAANAVGASSIGTERYDRYFTLATRAIPALSGFTVDLGARDENLALELL